MIATVRRLSGRLAALLALLACLGALAPQQAAADPETLRPLIDALGQGGFGERRTAIEALSAHGDAAAAPALEALIDRRLYLRRADGQVFIAVAAPGGLALTDAVTGEEAGIAPTGEFEDIRINNAVRRAVRSAIGALTLGSPDPAVRRAAVEAMFRTADPDSVEALDAAIAEEEDDRILRLMRQARAAALLSAGGSVEDLAAALEVLEDRGGRDTLALLNRFRPQAPEELIPTVDAAAAKIQSALRTWQIVQDLLYGLSLGSVLLLAAIGLAITFGVMGVINMAHGEMVMLGAYTTFVVQDVLRRTAPELFDYSLFLALPAAFLLTALIGILIERTIIRWLYGRPLETLMATWGLSLILQQLVRSIFGPTNQQVGNPSWMSGAFDVGYLSITYNRMWIFFGALAVFLILVIVLRRTALGLHMRAVTQNRRMAASVGIRTPWVDALTFGLGSGIAGIAGVALSQIDNVSPNLGTGYIIDSFMVVVFGGVGNLWGTLAAAFTLGIANKFLEPVVGAVVGKIVILVFIILFIQRRPRGLFPVRGRAAES